MNAEGMGAPDRRTAGAPRDQFLFEDKKPKEASVGAFSKDLTPKTDTGQKSAVGGLLSVFAYLALDLVWDSWEKTPSGQHFGDSLNGYLPHVSVYVPVVLLAGVIAVLVLTAHRARGLALASLWVHGRTFTLVPSSKKRVSFDLDAARVGTVTVREKAFAGGKSGLAVEDAAGKLHSIDTLSNAEELGPFAEHCRRVGIRFAHERESRAGQVMIGAVFAVIFLLFVCAYDHEHPVQAIVKLTCAMLVGFLVPRMFGEKE